MSFGSAGAVQICRVGRVFSGQLHFYSCEYDRSDVSSGSGFFSVQQLGRSRSDN